MAHSRSTARQALPDGRAHVPVSMCSPRFRTMDAGGFIVTEVWFPPEAVVPRHTHARPVLGVMMEGTFEDRFARRSLHPAVGELFTEPAQEGHTNIVGSGGARVLALQPDPADEELSNGARGLLDEVSVLRHAGVALAARRLAAELRRPDGLTGLAVESLALDMIVTASRWERPVDAPAWLARIDELVRDTFRDPLDLASLAREVGVHRAHLARVYRRHRGMPIASHVRALRLDWAARQLVESGMSLSSIANQAGFADQSHLTRWFKRKFGLPPGAYRTARRGG